ncbi:hypothetical protein FRC11_009739 [Ceratobasidium sp. 423]|nr:hypothetical protein FRC11_009739 [Ceratobasidium sp. 423]
MPSMGLMPFHKVVEGLLPTGGLVAELMCHLSWWQSNSQFTVERMASQSASWSARTYDDDLSAHSGYNNAQTGYDDAQSTAYDDAQGSDYHSESQVSNSQNYPASQGACSQSAHSQGTHSQDSLSQGQSKGQYSEDDGTSASLSINPQEILASLHSRMLDPVSFE